MRVIRLAQSLATIRACAIFGALMVLPPGMASPAHAQQTKTYTYDALGRLVEVERDRPGTATEEVVYTYDDAGNRVTYNSTGAVEDPPADPDPEPDPPPTTDPETRLIPVFNGRFFVMMIKTS